MHIHTAQDNVSVPHFRPDQFVVGPLVRITGAIVFEGEVLVAGQVQGEIRCRALVVSQEGYVEGVVEASEVIVEGVVLGKIHADRLVLKAACEVEGEIYHAELLLEEGCYFEGKSRRQRFSARDLQPSELGR